MIANHIAIKIYQQTWYKVRNMHTQMVRETVHSRKTLPSILFPGLFLMISTDTVLSMCSNISGRKLFHHISTIIHHNISESRLFELISYYDLLNNQNKITTAELLAWFMGYIPSSSVLLCITTSKQIVWIAHTNLSFCFKKIKFDEIWSEMT